MKQGRVQQQTISIGAANRQNKLPNVPRFMPQLAPQFAPQFAARAACALAAEGDDCWLARQYVLDTLNLKRRVPRAAAAGPVIRGEQ
jgi:hypothetical protein